MQYNWFCIAIKGIKNNLIKIKVHFFAVSVGKDSKLASCQGFALLVSKNSKWASSQVLVMPFDTDNCLPWL